VLADAFYPRRQTRLTTRDANSPTAGWALDIGTRIQLQGLPEALADAKTVNLERARWRVSSSQNFAAGNKRCAHTLAELSGTGCCTIIERLVDSVAARREGGCGGENEPHLQRGGASLEPLLEGKVPPGSPAALNDA